MELENGYEWVEIIEPRRQEHMFANLKTGQCLWEPPEGVNVKPTHTNQWWELYDTNTSRYYYHNAMSQKTVWKKPKNADIVALSNLQIMKAREASRKSFSKRPVEEESVYDVPGTVVPGAIVPGTVVSDDEDYEIPGSVIVGTFVGDANKVATTEPNNNSEYQVPRIHQQQQHTDDTTQSSSRQSVTLPRPASRLQTGRPVYHSFRKHAPAKPPRESRTASMSVKMANANFNVTVQSSPKPVRRPVGDPSPAPFKDLPASPPPTEQPTHFNLTQSVSRQSSDEHDYVNTISTTLPPTTPRPAPLSLDIIQTSSLVNSETQPEIPTPDYDRISPSFDKMMVITDDGDQQQQQQQSQQHQQQQQSQQHQQQQQSQQHQQHQQSQQHQQQQQSQQHQQQQQSQQQQQQQQSHQQQQQQQHQNQQSKYQHQQNKQQQSQHQPQQQQQLIPAAPPVPPLPPPAPPASVTEYRRERSLYDNLSSESIDDPDESRESATATEDRPVSLAHSDTNEVNRTSCYERLQEMETPAAVRKTDDPRSTPVKRSPLQRMKSDTLDVEKRAKFAKPLNDSGGGTAGFRPVSMLTLPTSSSSTKLVRKFSMNTTDKHTPTTEGAPALNTHRTGILRRRVSIHSMLSWSKSAIKKPMVMTRDKRVRKEAVDVFKLILQCMGEKSSRRSVDQLMVDITTKGWNLKELRDEIYIQLCKQTTSNPKEQSLQKGWELITACLHMFPPTRKFHTYLEGYIYRHLEAEVNETKVEKYVEKIKEKKRKNDNEIFRKNEKTEVKVDLYAKHCYKQLERIYQAGAKRGLKGPNAEEIHAYISRVFNPSMFGNTLEDIMEMQRERHPDNRLPWILTTLTEQVLLLNGLQTEGIFRVPGDIDEVNSFKVHIDSWNVPDTLREPHVPASLLKLWFRDMYEPLISQKFYDQCIHNCENTEVCLNIVNSLDPINNLVFCYLIRLLQAFMIPSNVEYSKMDENNLAMVWAPNCLRCPSEDPREIFESTRKEMTFLRTVMKSLDTSFLEGVV